MDAVGDVPVDVAVDVGAQHAEGPIWDSRTARLWWVDITGQAVHCSDPATGSDTAWSTPWQPGGIVLDEQGRPVVAAPDGLAVLDPDTGRTTLRVAVAEPNKPENRANDVTVDSHGRCWLGTMAFDKRPGNAALYVIDSGVVSCAVDGLTISNGPAFDEGGGRMYLADTALFRVDVFDLDPSTGALSGRRRFVDLGADGGDLYITTSWFDLEPGERLAQPLAGAIFTCRPGVTGAPAPRYGVTP